MDFPRITSGLLAMLCAGVLGCSPPPDRPALVLKGSGFFDTPWPSDDRTVNGQPEMTGFPGRHDIELVNDYITGIEELDGFGTNAPMFLRLDGPPSTLPTPQLTHGTDGPLFLIDIDVDSPERGQVVPLTARYQSVETPWQPDGLLALQPVWGYPLRPRTTYALVLTTDFIEPIDEFDLTQVKHRALAETLVLQAVDTKRITYSVEFTTQDPVGELAWFESRISSDLTLPALDQTVDRFRQTSQFSAYEGTMWVPMWQHGNKPYLSSGGGFAFDEDGSPLLAGWEAATFTVTVPNEQDMPSDGWPLVLYGHGTGGDNRSFATGSGELTVARVLASEGIAGFGISLPLHGDRGTSIDPALASFNYLNPESARACFRQGALDLVYLAELLTARIHTFDRDDGPAFELDPDRLAYMGHSHGGLIGAIAAPFMRDRVRAMFLSGAGGGLSTTVVTRDAGDFDIQDIISGTFNLTEDDELIETHPLVGMVQTLAETTDPINYAPYWHARTPFWDTTPQSVLMTEGLEDLQTPPDTAEALAAAGRLPIIAPASHVSDAHRFKSIGTHSSPTRHNLEAWDGTSVSGGLAQYGGQDHFVVFRDDDAAALYLRFLDSALDGAPPEIQDL